MRWSACRDGNTDFPDPIVNSFEDGEIVEVIQQDYPALSIAQIERLIAFARE